MGRTASERVHISKRCMKDALKTKGYTQISLAKDLCKDKDNLNKQIRTEIMEVSLLEEISKTIRVPKEYLRGELLVKESTDLFYPTEDRDSEGFLIPKYEETQERITFESVKDCILKIGNSLLDFQAFLVKEGYSSDSPINIKKLQLSECDYLFDRLRIIQELPSILHEIEIMREESNHGKEN